MNKEKLVEALNKAKKPQEYKISYGTAGFRGQVNAGLESVFVRTGMVAWCRAVVLDAAIGLCITASHNPVGDNGIKLIDPDGGMLHQSWEEIASKVANANTNQEAISLVASLLLPQSENGATGNNHSRAVVYLARDTRPHSERLEKLAIEGILACGGTFHSYGLLTTPQLHYLVMKCNRNGATQPPKEEEYYQDMKQPFLDLYGSSGPINIAVDCANGIGALKFPILLNTINQSVVSLFNANVTQHDKLNEACGAEHVQKLQKFPSEFDSLRCKYFASFDGDADRIVFYFTQNEKMVLLDGDKIASLFTLFITKQLSEMKIIDSVSLATVQTGYANGSSREFLTKQLHVRTPIVKTGVKYLHHEAINYDIGVYFEANGHGTVLFKPEFIKRVEEMPDGGDAKSRLLSFIRLINQSTGDAMSDFLAVVCVLKCLNLDFHSWSNLYTDLPSKQTKVKVKDRSKIKTNESESRVLDPIALQNDIDVAVGKFSKARAFARPSGTEDYVRVYAEAETQREADELAELVGLAIGRSDEEDVKHDVKKVKL